MDAVLKWVTAVLAIWGAVSILVAIAWALAGRKIFRQPPTPEFKLVVQRMSEQNTEDIAKEIKRLHRLNGGA